MARTNHIYHNKLSFLISMAIGILEAIDLNKMLK